MKKQTLVIILLAVLVVSCLALTACQKHEHEFGEWTVVKQPTCTQDGSKERVCECGEKETEVVDITGIHNFQEADTCEYCGLDIADVAVDSYNMSATTDDNVKGYVVPRMYGKYDAYIKGAGAMKYYGGSPFEVDGYNVVDAYIEKGVTSISDYAFRNCYSLTSVIFEEGSQLTSIGNDAFYGCKSITSISIPESVTSIGNHAFSSCASLKSVVIPDGVISIGDDAFYGCISLTSITIEGAPQIGRAAFEYTPYYQNADNWQNKVLYIGNCLIEAKNTIETCTIKEGIKVIADGAFAGCTDITSITIPSSVTSIGNDAFYGCKSLISITIPESVTSIGFAAFYNCNSLTSVTFADPNGWYRTTTEGATSGTSLTLTDASRNAIYLTSTYRSYYWYKNN